MKKSVIGIILLAALIIYGVYDSMDKSSGERAANGENREAGAVETGIKKGQLAPDFELADLNGNVVRLSDFRGSIVIVNFWATWCPPCKVEMPHMEKFYQDYKDRDVVVLAVNLATIEKRDSDVYTFAEEYGLELPILLDAEGRLKEQYRITAYPTTYFIDQEGVIRQKYPGAIDYEVMKKTLQQLG